jgi:hypothetical protein
MNTPSPSMWAFLMLAPLLLLLANRRQGSPPPDAMVFAPRLSIAAELWTIACAVAALAALLCHLVLPHPDGADYEGLRALRFFTAWCFVGVAAYFVGGALRILRVALQRGSAVCPSSLGSRHRVHCFYTVAPPSLLVDVVFWAVIFPTLPPHLRAHAFRFDEISMHALNVPVLLLDCLLFSSDAASARMAGLWRLPLGFTASYLPFHWAWLAAGGSPIYEFLQPSLPWAGAIHAALLALVLACFHIFRALVLAKSRCDKRGVQGLRLIMGHSATAPCTQLSIPGVSIQST